MNICAVFDFIVVRVGLGGYCYLVVQRVLLDCLCSDYGLLPTRDSVGVDVHRSAGGGFSPGGGGVGLGFGFGFGYDGLRL